jgi:predicted extracellular nuclease
MQRRVISLFLLALAACVGDAPVTTPPSDGGSGADSTILPDAAPQTVTIQTIRDPSAPGHPALGTWVTVEGAVVTGVKSAGTTHTFFIQDPGAKAWGGLYVYAGTTIVSLGVGAIVKVTGFVAAFRGMDQLDVTKGSFEMTGSTNPPPPIDVTPSDIREGSATAAQYQSMVLRVKNVKAKTATTGIDFVVTSASGTDDLIVTSFAANDIAATPFPATAGQTYTSITGRGFSFGLSDQSAVAKLAPVSAAEVVTP